MARIFDVLASIQQGRKDVDDPQADGSRPLVQLRAGGRVHAMLNGSALNGSAHG
jgi:hypothetical protein